MKTNSSSQNFFILTKFLSSINQQYNQSAIKTIKGIFQRMPKLPLFDL